MDNYFYETILKSLPLIPSDGINVCDSLINYSELIGFRACIKSTYSIAFIQEGLIVAHEHKKGES